MSSINGSCSTCPCSSDKDGSRRWARNSPAIAGREGRVATVLGVHLHETAAVGRFGPVELGAPAFHPRRARSTQVDAGSLGRNGSRGRPPVGCTEHHEEPGSRGGTHGQREINSGNAALPAAPLRRQRHVGGATPPRWHQGLLTIVVPPPGRASRATEMGRRDSRSHS
jgi:hypothetical protein